MDKPGSVDPHAIEGHTKAHREAFDALVERIGKAARKPQAHDLQRSIGSKTHRAYRRLHFGWHR